MLRSERLSITPWLVKLRERRIWQRILVERLSEPIHLNVLSLGAAAFGSVETKILFDLIIRQHHAFALLNAARSAKMLGVSRVTAVEFGVASGAGLENMCAIAARIEDRLHVHFDIVGFDSGTGMPPPRDFRDHPEHYSAGDFPMQDMTRLGDRLPANATLRLGPLSRTVPAFIPEMSPTSPLAFVSLDVDYYSSSVDALKIFGGDPQTYLPAVDLYVDDLTFPTHNSWSGELGAIREFNQHHDFRKIEPRRWLRESRRFKNAAWISHMYTVHILDHALRSPDHVAAAPTPRLLENPYLTRR